jgi:hypothetical protein
VGRYSVDGGKGEIRVQCALCRRWYRAIHYSHLKSRHGWSGPDAPQRYKERFGVTFLWSAAPRLKLGRSIVHHHDRIGRKWSQEAMLEEVRVRTAAGRPMHLAAALAEGLRHLGSAATVHLVSWGEACRAAGIKEYRLRKSWSREEVFAEIQARHRAGQGMFQRAVLADHQSPVAGARKCVGSSTEALRLTGVPPELWKEKGGPFGSRAARFRAFRCVKGPWGVSAQAGSPGTGPRRFDICPLAPTFTSLSPAPEKVASGPGPHEL